MVNNKKHLITCTYNYAPNIETYGEILLKLEEVNLGKSNIKVLYAFPKKLLYFSLSLNLLLGGLA